jgi:hypothetical protein
LVISLLALSMCVLSVHSFPEPFWVKDLCDPSTYCPLRIITYALNNPNSLKSTPWLDFKTLSIFAFFWENFIPHDLRVRDSLIPRAIFASNGANFANNLQSSLADFGQKKASHSTRGLSLLTSNSTDGNLGMASRETQSSDFRPLRLAETSLEFAQTSKYNSHQEGNPNR